MTNDENDKVCPSCGDPDCPNTEITREAIYDKMIEISKTLTAAEIAADIVGGAAMARLAITVLRDVGFDPETLTDLLVAELAIAFPSTEPETDTDNEIDARDLN